MRNELINNYSKLNDICIQMERIQQFISGHDFKSFVQDTMLFYAVERAIITIGEATKKLSATFVKGNPQLLWREMAGICDRFVHNYDEIDYERLWKIITIDVPRDLVLIRDLIIALDAELIRQGK